MLKRTLLAAYLAAATTTAFADPVSYDLDPAHTNVVASWNHLGFSYPEITFTSTAVEAAGEGKLEITGDLTIKGITRTVVLDATLNGAGPHPMAGREAIGFDASMTVKRSEFGLGYAVPAVSDEITLRITTEGLVPEV